MLIKNEILDLEAVSEPINVVSSIPTFQSAVEYLNTSVIILLTTNGTLQYFFIL